MFQDIREEDIRELLDAAIQEREEYLTFYDADEETEELDIKIEELEMALWYIAH